MFSVFVRAFSSHFLACTGKSDLLIRLLSEITYTPLPVCTPFEMNSAAWLDDQEMEFMGFQEFQETNPGPSSSAFMQGDGAGSG